MNITFCIMYTKHRKIFTSIKTTKYCTDKNSQDIERKKKILRQLKENPIPLQNPNMQIRTNSYTCIHLQIPITYIIPIHTHKPLQSIQVPPPPPPRIHRKKLLKKTHKIAKHINREICMQGSQS